MTLFADKAVIAAELKADRLILAGKRYFPGVTLGTDFLYAKILAAEKYVERRLRVFLEPVEILPQSATQAERDTFDNYTVESDNGPVPAPIRWMEEPGYDLTPSTFQGESWGFVPLFQKPVISVHSVKFVYPQPATQEFEIPANWIRLDKRHGHIQMVPSGTAAFAAPLNMWMMQAMSGGRSIPQMIQVRYRAGLSDIATEHPDVLDLVKKFAVLSILQDAFLPQSASKSIDGMSQSFGADVDKFGDMLDKKADTMRQSLRGIGVGVL